MKRICCTALVFVALLILSCKQKQEVPNGDDSGTTIVEKAITVNLIFDKTQGSVKAKLKNGGDVQSFPVKLKDGDIILFTATPNPNYEVETWEGVDSFSNDKLTATLEVKKDTTVSVKYKLRKPEEKKFDVNLLYDKQGGSVVAKFEDGQDISSFPVKAKEGAKILFTATPNSNYEVEAWEGVDSFSNDKLTATLEVKKDTTVSVKYKTNQVTLDELVDVNPPEQGIIGKKVGYSLPQFNDYQGVFTEGRKVKLSPYKICRTACTYGLYYNVREWAEKNGYSFAKKGVPGSFKGAPPAQPGEGYENEGAKPNDATKNHPVTAIGIGDILVWCNAYTEMTMGESECVYRAKEDHNVILKASSVDKAEVLQIAFADITKKGFRLPSEAEWEFAARYQGDGSKDEHKENAEEYGTGVWLTKLDSFSGAKKPAPLKIFYSTPPQGETYQALIDHSLLFGDFNRYYDEKDPSKWARIDDRPQTKEVGQKRPNALGIYDMSGGINEYCFDPVVDDEPLKNTVTKYDSKYMKDGFVVNPLGAMGEEAVKGRIYRGGNYASNAEYCLSGARFRVSTLYVENNFHNGFRVVCSK